VAETRNSEIEAERDVEKNNAVNHVNLVIGNGKEAEVRNLLIAAEIVRRASKVNAGLKPQELC
jgi:hypothetical protein